MVHFLPVIKHIENIHPKSKSERKVKRRVLRLLYGVEAKEARQKQSRRRRSGEAPLLSKGEKQAISGFARFVGRAGHAGVSGGISAIRRQRQAIVERRLQKARTVKLIRESNLPESVKQREVAKLSGVASQTRAKSAFFKAQRIPRELRQSAEANF